MIIKLQVLYEITLLDFLKLKNVSKRLLPKIKTIVKLNGVHQLLSVTVFPNDCVEFKLPLESTEIVRVDESLDILYDDEYLTIINKPAGVNSIPDRYQYGIINFIQHYYDKEKNVAHIVTRLDKDTSGCVLIAKHQYIQACLAKTYIDKTYIAVVRGVLKCQHSMIDLPISKMENQIKRHVHCNGKSAQTLFTVVGNVRGNTIVKVKLKTGRTHQIRVHFSAIGHPLVADELYGSTDEIMKRQALHMHQLRFIHPITNELLTIQSPLPDDILQLV